MFYSGDNLEVVQFPCCISSLFVVVFCSLYVCLQISSTETSTKRSFGLHQIIAGKSCRVQNVLCCCRCITKVLTRMFPCSIVTIYLKVLPTRYSKCLFLSNMRLVFTAGQLCYTSTKAGAIFAGTKVQCIHKLSNRQ